MADVRIDAQKLRALVRAPGGQGMRWLIQLGNRVKNGAQIKANVRTGRMRASIQMIVTGSATVRVGTDVKYAAYVHGGTRPHVIVPRTRSTLRFVSGGQVRFARRVNHPGYRGNPFLTDALREEIDRL